MNEIIDIYNLIKKDSNTYLDMLNMTANENIISENVRNVLSNNLLNKYHIGIAEKIQDKKLIEKDGLAFQNLVNVNRLEIEARKKANEMYKTQFVDFRLLTGVHAVMALLLCATDPNDLIYILHPEKTGHFATVPLIETSGRRYKYIPWNPLNYNIDINALEKEIEEEMPRMVLLDSATPICSYPVEAIRSAISKETILVYDVSHTLGLFLSDNFVNPIQAGCDIIIGNTHKTFFGPHKAIMAFKNYEYGKSISDKITLTTISSQQTNQSLALYIAMLEMHQFGKEYSNQVLLNGKVLSKYLEDLGFEIFKVKNEFPVNHMVLIKQNELVTDALELGERLMEHNISINVKVIFGERMLRIGVQDITRRGMKEEEMKGIANLIYCIAKNKSYDTNLKEKVKKMSNDFKNIEYSFDKIIEE